MSLKLTDDVAKKLKNDLIKMGLPPSKVGDYMQKEFGYKEKTKIELLTERVNSLERKRFEVANAINEYKSYILRNLNDYGGTGSVGNHKFSFPKSGCGIEEKVLPDTFYYCSLDYSKYGTDFESRWGKNTILIPEWSRLPSNLKHKVEKACETLNEVAYVVEQNRYKDLRNDLKHLNVQIKCLKKEIKDEEQKLRQGVDDENS